jgi:hypothetical protein
MRIPSGPKSAWARARVLQADSVEAQRYERSCPWETNEGAIELSPWDACDPAARERTVSFAWHVPPPPLPGNRAGSSQRVPNA